MVVGYAEVSDYLLVGVACVAEGEDLEAIISGKAIGVLAWRG